MDKNLGGRGKKAPYETTHVRIPVPIKDRVEYLKELYLNDLLERSLDENKLVTLEDALLEAKNILKLKQSARKSVLKLLTALYGIQISEEDLKD
jgi:hypothetical protein